MNHHSAGNVFRKAVHQESPLQVVGTINANQGISNLDDVLTDVRCITDVCDLPLLVDIDTGFGASAFNVARTIKSRLNLALRHCSP